MSRFRAALVHFGICASIGLILLSFFWTVWYPPPLFDAVGGLNIFLMLLAVDVVLGPLLTFVVFKSGKKSLKFDLFVIGVLQVLALSYGVFTLFAGRPVYVAALGHRFDVIQASDVSSEELVAEARSLPWFGPKWVGTRTPSSSSERERVLFSGSDYGHFPQHHQPLENMQQDILSRAQPISELKRLNAGRESHIDAWLAERNLSADAVRFQGLKARNKDFTIIIDARTAQVIGVAPFTPWPE